MPEVPTPGVNGHVLSVKALQASMSISSFEPAARMFGWFTSTASAGSFCLFCENGVGGLPTLTSVSGLNADAGRMVTASNANAASGNNTRRHRLYMDDAPFAPPGGDRRLDGGA